MGCLPAGRSPDGRRPASHAGNKAEPGARAVTADSALVTREADGWPTQRAGECTGGEGAKTGRSFVGCTECAECSWRLLRNRCLFEYDAMLLAQPAIYYSAFSR